MKYKAAIIGTGRIGYFFQKDKKREQPASHSKALKKNKNIKIIAGCDIDKRRIKEWHKDYSKANIYYDHKKLLNNETSDIVVIAVDEEAHLNVTLDVIEHSPKLIILEKPVAPDISLAKQIERKAQKYNVPICINHERRFSKDYIILKKLIDQNKLGNIHSINARLWTGMKAWNKDCRKNGACALIHDGTHLLDIIHFLFDISIRSPKIDKIIRSGRDGVSSVFLHCETNKKNLLYLEINGDKKYFGLELDIIGSNGRAIIGNGYLKVYKSFSSPYYSGFMSLKKVSKYKRPEKTEYFSNMISNCVDFLNKKSVLMSPLSEGIRAVRALEEIAKTIENF